MGMRGRNGGWRGGVAGRGCTPHGLPCCGHKRYLEEVVGGRVLLVELKLDGGVAVLVRLHAAHGVHDVLGGGVLLEG